MKWIVSVGAIFALCTSLLGCMFPLPRILYAMSNDGILYKLFMKVHPKTQTPLVATLLSGLMAALMALMFNLHQLIDMMSIGTLLAYTIVSVCVLLLRYRDDKPDSFQKFDVSTLQIVRQLFNLNHIKIPNELSTKISKNAIVAFCLGSIVLCFLLSEPSFQSTYFLIFLVATVFILISIVVIISRQPTSGIKLTFKVPLVPILPCLSIAINIYLMLQLDFQTWIRFAIWILFGYIIYFTYGIQNSVEGHHLKLEIQNKQINSASVDTNLHVSNASTLALTQYAK